MIEPQGTPKTFRFDPATARTMPSETATSSSAPS